MLRSLINKTWTLSHTLTTNPITRPYSLLTTSLRTCKPPITLLSHPITPLLPLQIETSQRTLTKFSFGSGKRKTVKAVIKRFKRLHWGAWIRTISGRHKKIWKKSLNQQRRLRQHVFVNATQSKLLDKMVTGFWKKPKYYVNDPYEPYHTRQEFMYTKRP